MGSSHKFSSLLEREGPINSEKEREKQVEKYKKKWFPSREHSVTYRLFFFSSREVHFKEEKCRKRGGKSAN